MSIALSNRVTELEKDIVDLYELIDDLKEEVEQLISTKTKRKNANGYQ